MQARLATGTPVRGSGGGGLIARGIVGAAVGFGVYWLIANGGISSLTTLVPNGVASIRTIPKVNVKFSYGGPELTPDERKNLHLTFGEWKWESPYELSSTAVWGRQGQHEIAGPGSFMRKCYRGATLVEDGYVSRPSTISKGEPFKVKVQITEDGVDRVDLWVTFN